MYGAVAQCVVTPDGRVIDRTTGGDCVNVIPTALPFLTIIPDARGAAMGDIGVATSADAAKMHYNQSMLAFADKQASFAASYTPWLRDLGLNDVFLGAVNGYYKLNDLQAIGAQLKYFSYGTINFRDVQGQPLGTGEPYELEFALAYARKLSDNLSAAIGGKYLYSNLAVNQGVGGTPINAASAVAADISLTYKNQLKNGNELTIATVVKNIGNKISYTEESLENHIPTNFSLGVNYDMFIDDYNRFSIGLELNKLLVPSPQVALLENGDPNPDYDTDGNGIPDFREQSVIGSIFSSWGDAPNGFSEELQEFTWALGAEYWYNDQFAVRAGYYNEHQNKGNRKYLTAGLGVKYNVFGLDFSYLVATNGNQNPLNNTFRFTLSFDIDAFTYDDGIE